MSSLIFILCTEALVIHFNHAENQGKITGMCVSRASPPVLHLLFADDSMFFYKAEPRECDKFMKELRTYGKTFGQCINFEKYSLLFGKMIPRQVNEAFKNSTGITNDGGMRNYLGIPEDISGSKNKLFAFQKERLHNRVNN